MLSLSNFAKFVMAWDNKNPETTKSFRHQSGCMWLAQSAMTGNTRATIRLTVVVRKAVTMTTHSAEFTLSRMECTKTCGSDDNKHITCTGALNLH